MQDIVDATLEMAAGSDRTGIKSTVNMLYSSHSWSSTWGWIEGTPCSPRGPTCQSDNPVSDDPFYAQFDACAELSCEGSKIFKSRAYWTVRPIRHPAATHTLSYTLGSGAKVSYTPNPNVVWTVDLTAPNKTSVSATMLHNIVFTDHDGSSFDLTHTADVRAMANHDLNAPESFSAVILFSRLAPKGWLRAVVNLDAAKRPAGSVTFEATDGDVRVGEFKSAPRWDNWYVSYTWAGLCEQ